MRSFTKDLKPSDISLSFLTGKAVLQKIELNAEFLTEIFHLPPCLQISRVVCDLIKADVPFTSLGSNPIQIVSKPTCSVHVAPVCVFHVP